MEAIANAINAGYRLLDTAVDYGNETTVGEAIRSSGVPRVEIRVSIQQAARAATTRTTMRSFPRASHLRVLGWSTSTCT